MANLTWPLSADLAPSELDRLLYPGKSGKAIKTLPSWLDIDTELSRKGVTKQLLWMEYQAAVGGGALGYSQFSVPRLEKETAPLNAHGAQVR